MVGGGTLDVGEVLIDFAIGGKGDFSGLIGWKGWFKEFRIRSFFTNSLSSLNSLNSSNSATIGAAPDRTRLVSISVLRYGPGGTSVFW